MALSQQSLWGHSVFEERAGERGEGFDGHREVGAGREPCCAVLGEATTGHKVMDVGVVLEVPAPGVQDPGQPPYKGRFFAK
jgi:hypothetical protein